MIRRFPVIILISMLLVLMMSGLCEAKNGGVAPRSFNYLYKGQSLMFVNTNNTISAKGETFAYTNVEKIAVTVYLQKYNGSSWSTVQSCYNCSYNNSYVICRGTSGTLSPGTYRVRSYHRVDHNGTVETMNSYTNPQII